MLEVELDLLRDKIREFITSNEKVSDEVINMYLCFSTKKLVNYSVEVMKLIASKRLCVSRGTHWGRG